jgi:hypothetical protein
MTSEGALPPEHRAAVGQAMNALQDLLLRLEPVTGPDEVTRSHSPEQDRCDDLTCPCALPPAGAVPINAADLDGPRARIPGWKDGHTSALLVWRSWDGPVRPEDPGAITTWKRTATDQDDVLETLAHFTRHADTSELVSAWLLPGPGQAGAAG